MTGLFAQPAATAFSVLHQSLVDLILLRTSSQLSRSTCDKYSCMFSGHLHVTPDSHLRCCSICTTHCCMMCLMESFSRSRTQPHGSSPAPDDVITSRMCCVSCTGFLSGNDESTTRCLLHQSLSGLTPAYLADDVNLVADSGRRLLRSAADRTCVVPRTHNTFGNRSFTAAGPRVWNNLPSQMRHDISYGQFKRQMKTFLFGIN